MAKWHYDAARQKYTGTPREGVRAPLPLVFGPSAELLFMRGYAEEEGWPDMANGHVLSRAPQWAQAQYQ
jgi:hypothetical protein